MSRTKETAASIIALWQDGWMPDTFGAAVKTLRKKRRWTLAQLAKRAGVSESAVSRYESGARSPKHVHAVKIARAFDVDVSTLGVTQPSEVREAVNMTPNLDRAMDEFDWDKNPVSLDEYKKIDAALRIDLQILEGVDPRPGYWRARIQQALAKIRAGNLD